MHKKIYIRCDGSPEIGLGHVVRCISLAHMLTKDFSIHFYVLEIVDSLKNEIIQNGWEITLLENESKFLNSLIGNEIVVLDGYKFDSEYQNKIKSNGSKLVCIDDFHNQYFYADLVINHAPGVKEKDYKGEQYTKYLLGPDYALLRPEFLKNKPSEDQRNWREVENILICFGGSDFKNLTAKILSWLPSENYIVTLILGNGYTHKDELVKLIKERRDLKVVVKNSLSAKEMRNELQKTDLAIVPASGILFEVISTGVPVISGHYTDNQLAIYNGFLNEGIIINAKSFSKDSFTTVFKKIKSYDLVAILSKQGKLIDGKSAIRIKKRFLELW